MSFRRRFLRLGRLGFRGEGLWAPAGRGDDPAGADGLRDCRNESGKRSSGSQGGGTSGEAAGGIAADASLWMVLRAKPGEWAEMVPVGKGVGLVEVEGAVPRGKSAGG